MKTLLAIFAHPDDEAFRPGGTLSMLARRGVRIQVLTATDGGRGSCGEPPLCTSKELTAMREGELRCACAALGIEPPILMDYQDGRLSEADPETIIAEILSVMAEVSPQVMMTFGPDGSIRERSLQPFGGCERALHPCCAKIPRRYPRDVSNPRPPR